MRTEIVSIFMAGIIGVGCGAALPLVAVVRCAAWAR